MADASALPRIIGQRGTARGQFNLPRAIDIAPDGRVGLADRSGRLMLYSAAGESLLEWKLPAWDNGTPTGVIFDTTDPATPTLLVADIHYSKILRYGLDGALISQFGEYGSEPGKMIYPTDIALDAEGTMYIAEYGLTDRINKFTRDGTFIAQWGASGTEAGQFQRALGLIFLPPDKILVADTCNHRLQLFTTQGELLEVWGGVGNGPGQFNYPYDLAADKQGRIYVIEYGNNRLQVLDSRGRCLALYGGPGTAPGQFGTPWGVATAPDGKVWIADTLNHRLQVLDGETLIAHGRFDSRQAAVR